MTNITDTYGTNRTLGEQCHDALVKTGEAKAKAFSNERLYKRQRAHVYLAAQGTVAVRDALARTNDVVVAAEDLWIKAEMDYNLLRAESDGLNVRFEEYRTQAATTRAEMTLR